MMISTTNKLSLQW